LFRNKAVRKVNPVFHVKETLVSFIGPKTHGEKKWLAAKKIVLSEVRNTEDHAYPTSSTLPMLFATINIKDY